MGIWSSFLDFLWPVAAKKPEPEPLPPLDFRALRGGAVYDDGRMVLDHSPLSQPHEVRQRPAGDQIPQMWQTWPVEQWAPAAERKLRRITGSRRLKGGGNSTKPRAVISADGTRYPSVRAAAKACGVAPSTVWDQVAEGRDGWRYAD